MARETVLIFLDIWDREEKMIKWRGFVKNSFFIFSFARKR